MTHVISISSHVAYGAVGNRIMVPAFEMLGFAVSAINTVQLPWHPGMNTQFGKGTKIVPDDNAFAAMIDNLAAAPWLSEIDGIITGYLGSPAQATAIAILVKALKHANPNALYLCDPVVGDNGGLYVPEETALAIRDHLWPIADIVTPNLFEFGWMTDTSHMGKDQLIEVAAGLGKRAVIITSASADALKISNVLVTSDVTYISSYPFLDGAPNGTGDMLAACFMARLINGKDDINAVYEAGLQVHHAISHAKTTSTDSLEPAYLRGMDLSDLRHVSIDVL
jgi:pyridoxine kinase